jgi:predicted RNA-binding protein with PUA-like domain
MNYWLVKQEPSDFSWADLDREGNTAWTGVRNFQARNHLRGMKKGDLLFFYHSGEEKSIVGVARVKTEAYPDPTAEEGDWVCVDIVPERKLQRPVSLQTIKADPALKDLALVRQSRLSVMPVAARDFKHLLKLSGTPE